MKTWPLTSRSTAAFEHDTTESGQTRASASAINRAVTECALLYRCGRKKRKCWPRLRRAAQSVVKGRISRGILPAFVIFGFRDYLTLRTGLKQPDRASAKRHVFVTRFGTRAGFIQHRSAVREGFEPSVPF